MEVTYLCLIDKLSFPSFSIFGFLLKLPIESLVSQIIKALCSSSYSFHFRHLSFNDIMKEAVPFSEYDRANWLLYEGYYLEVSSSLLYGQELVHSLTILSSPFSSSTTFQSSPNTSTLMYLVSRSLSHIKQCSKHNTYPFSSWAQCLACLSWVTFFC